MAGKKPDEVLTIGVELESRRALQAMKRLEQDMKGELKAVGKAVTNFGKLNQDVLKDLVDNTKEYIDELDDLELAHNRQYKQLDKIADQIDALQKKQEKASESAKKDIEEQINLLKKQSNTMASRVAMKIVSTASTNKMRKDMTEMFGKVVDDAGGIFGSFFNKDLKGLIEGGTKGAGKVLGFGLSKAAGAAMRSSVRMKDTGAGMASKGTARGGVGGSAMAGMGKALQGVGGLFAKLGPMLNTVSKLGPLFGLASSALMAVVKLFIDAEAQAKQFQKEVLQSASTTEYLAASGGDVDSAFARISSTMRELRDSAYSLDNLKWGITADEHKQVLNVLNQEGVSLRRIADEAQSAKKTVGQFAADLTHVSVAYSRAFGVPLQEINQLQAEMMTELGMSLETTRLQFAQMTRSAAESGIAANKFFSIIRGVSADLSLYNSRLEDAVKTLKLLGKVMNPREAQKFMQTAMQALKGMGRTDLLKTALLGGPGASKALQRDLDQKAKNIGEDIAKAGGKAGLTREDLLSKPVADLLSGVNEEQQGAIRSALADFRMDTKASKQGVFGRSMAMRNVGPAAGLEVMKQSLNIAGTGKLADRIGDLGTQMLAENQGISMEQLAGMAKFEMAIDDTKAALISGLQKNDPATLEKLAKAGITATEAGIEAASMDQIYDTMDDSAKKQHESATKVESLGEKQARLTSDLLSKLDTLVQWFMNTFYNAILDIYDAILQGLSNLPGAIGAFAKEKLGTTAAQRAAQEHGGAAKSELLGASQKGGAAVLQTQISRSVQATVFEAWKKRKAGWSSGGVAEKLSDAAAKKETGESYIKPGQEWSKADDEFVKDMEQTQKLLGAEQKIFTEMSRQFSAEDWAKALESAGLGADVISTFTSKMAADPSLSATGVLSGMEASGSIEDEKLMQAFQNLFKVSASGRPVVSDVSMENRTKSLGLGANILNEAGLYKPLESTSKATETTADATKALNEHGTVKKNSIYVRFGNSFLTGDYRKTIEEATLASLRTALFEFYMYSQMNPEDVAKFLSDEGMTVQQFAATVSKEAEQGRTPKDFTGGLEYTQAPGNANGGIVTGINGGLAMVRAAAGEGLASIGPGEHILPAGAGRGGGDQFNINVNGIGGNDLARFLQVKVADGIVEYKRRQRFA